MDKSRTGRIIKARQGMELLHADALIVSKPENIFYLSGFTGGEDGLLLVDEDGTHLITDGRYYDQVKMECPGVSLIENASGDYVQSIKPLASKYSRVLVETHHITHDFYTRLRSFSGWELVSAARLIESQRIIKEPYELEMLRTSALIGDAALEQMIGYMGATPVTEGQAAAMLNFLMTDKGCTAPSFDTMVLYGDKAALPHGRPGDRGLELGDMILFDFGGFYRGYTADISRTWFYEKASAESIYRYNAVLEAQEAGISMIKAGVRAVDVHMKVKKVLAQYNLDQYFTHSTGHGIGLEIHEEPRISPTSQAVLEAGMVVTVEPGVYIPGWGGIRIEDSVIVTEQGCESITLSSKDVKYITEG